MTDKKSDGNGTGDGIERSEFAKLVHGHLNKYISLADNKASILLSALVAYLGISLSVIGSSWADLTGEFKILSGLTVITALAAVYFSAKAVYPNTPETPQGLILWDSITAKDREEYQSEIMEKPEKRLLEELIDENYKLAEVSVKKYTRVRRALLFTGATVALAIFTVSVFLYLA